MIRKQTVAFLLSIYALLVGWIGWSMCPNKTEAGHMAASVHFWHTLRFDVFRVNPPLTRMVAGLPIAICSPKCGWECYSSRPRDRSEWAMGKAFMAANSEGKIRWCFALARWSLIPFLLLGGYFGHRLSREMFGNAAALLFLMLWCFSPLLLAWGGTVCPDVPAAALGIVAVYTFRQWLYKPTWTHAAVAGVCLGVLPLAKLTWIIAFGLWPLIWCAWAAPIYAGSADKRPLPLPPLHQLMFILLLGLYTLNLGYLFDGTFRPLGKYEFASHVLRGQQASENGQAPVGYNRFAGTWLGKTPVPLPADFVEGIDTQRYDFEQGLPSYLRGEWDDHGWWYYYLYALAIKEPLGTWCLVTLAMAAVVFGRGYAASWRDEMIVLAPFAAILVLVSSQTGFSVHLRYVIPALPFLFIWASKVGRAFEMRPFTRLQLAVATMVTVALTWAVASSLSIYPHSLSYFNESAAILPTPADASCPMPIGRCNASILSKIVTAGPLNGPRHLLGSNIDWGQDLFYLEEWCESHPEARPIRVVYWGSYPLDRSNVKSAGEPPSGPSTNAAPDTVGPLPGWYALSVSEIYSRVGRYRYFLRFRPTAMAGYSIYIYNITLEEANQVRKALGIPQLPKDWPITGGHG